MPTPGRTPESCVSVAPATVVPGGIESAIERAMPKSMITGVPSASIITLAGFRSRCSTRAAWAAASPEATERAIVSVRPTDSLPSRRRTLARSSPLMSRHRDVLDACSSPGRECERRSGE